MAKGYPKLHRNIDPIGDKVWKVQGKEGMTNGARRGSIAYYTECGIR
jgi:hypothetical protein